MSFQYVSQRRSSNVKMEDNVFPTGSLFAESGSCSRILWIFLEPHVLILYTWTTSFCGWGPLYCIWRVSIFRMVISFEWWLISRGMQQSRTDSNTKLRLILLHNNNLRNLRNLDSDCDRTIPYEINFWALIPCSLL